MATVTSEKPLETSSAGKFIVKSNLFPGKQFVYEPINTEYIFAFDRSITGDQKQVEQNEQRMVKIIENHEKRNNDKNGQDFLLIVNEINGRLGFARVVPTAVYDPENSSYEMAVAELENAATSGSGTYMTAFTDLNPGFVGKIRYFFPNRVLVQFKDSVKNYTQPLFPSHHNHDLGNYTARKNIVEVELPKEKQTGGKSTHAPIVDALQKYNSDPRVKWAIPDQIIFPQPLWTPNDEKYKQYKQWGLRNNGSFPTSPPAQNGCDIKAYQAWQVDSTGAYVPGLLRADGDNAGNYGIPVAAGDPEQVVVAIIDCGVEDTHTSLAPNYVAGYDATGGGSTLPCPGVSHGTALAGICVGQRAITTAQGAVHPVVGVAPLCKFMPVKISSAASAAQIADAIDYVRLQADTNDDNVGAAAKRYVLLIGQEWAYDALIDTELEDAMNSNVLVVCAAGNSGGASPVYPASSSTASAANRLISVGAITADEYKRSSSNAGCTIFAPGETIWSCVNGDSWSENNSGTSMAAAFIAGSAAVLWSRHFKQSGNTFAGRSATDIKTIIADPTNDQTTNDGYKYLNLKLAVMDIP